MVLFVRMGGAQVETAGAIAREYSLYRKTDGFLYTFHNTKVSTASRFIRWLYSYFSVVCNLNTLADSC